MPHDAPLVLQTIWGPEVNTPVDVAVEGAKAGQEAAKLGQQVVGLMQGSLSWFSGRLTEPLDAAIGWALTDNLQYGREASRLRKVERLQLLAHRSQARLDMLGIEAITPPSDRLLTNLIEAAALEDDSNLQEMWAELMAQALTSEESDVLQWVTILRDLRPVDAKALQAYFLGGSEVMRKDHHFGRLRVSLDGEAFGFPIARNLQRLGLIEPVTITYTVVTDIEVRDRRAGLEPSTADVEYSGGLYMIQMTETGTAFCKAVGMQAPETGDTT